MNLFYVLLFLLVVFFSGWWIVWRVGVCCFGVKVSEFFFDYFCGLNYLFNEEQDKVIEVFFKLVEYNCDMVEIYLVLGNLFCWCGEVDWVIWLYQYLVFCFGFFDVMKIVVLLEFGEDYM